MNKSIPRHDSGRGNNDKSTNQRHFRGRKNKRIVTFYNFKLKKKKNRRKFIGNIYNFILFIFFFLTKGQD